jgi:hypothetical protein
MTFNRSTLAKEVSAINFDLLDPDLAAHFGSAFVEIIPATYNPSHESDPEGFTSCDNLFQSLDPMTANTTSNDAINVASLLAEVNRLAPPVTERLVDANLPGGLYERISTTGGSVEMGGTTVIQVALKQTTMAHNSTEAEIDAASFLGKILRWLVLFMGDLGLPFQGPIPIAEDNAATRLIAHASKITRNVRHVAIKTLGLQGLVRNGIAVFNSIGTAHNRSDHFTKPLPFPAFREHDITKMMGLRFFTREHGRYTARRNHEDSTNG